MNFKANKKIKKILLYFVRILTIILLGLGIGYYFFPGVTLGFSWQSAEKSMQNSSNYFVDKNMNAAEKLYINLYNNEHYGLKYIFSDGYTGFDSYLIARDNYLRLDVHDVNALANNVKQAHNVDSNIFIDEIRSSILGSIDMFDTLIVNDEFQTIISGSLTGGIMIILSSVFPYFFYNYYYYNSVFRTGLNIYYFRMKRKEKRKRSGNSAKRTSKKQLKELQKISRSEFLEIYFFKGEDDYLKKDFNAEENLMFHKPIKIILKFAWILILSAIILIICDALIVINRDFFYGPLFIVGYILCAPLIMFFIFLQQVYEFQEYDFKINTNFVIDWPFHGKLLWYDDYISASELFPHNIIDFSINRNDSINIGGEYTINLSWYTTTTTNFNTKTWLLDIRETYYKSMEFSP